MLPHYRYEAARHDARFHVQLRIEGVGEVDRTPSFVEVRGVVVKVFRGADALAEGDRMAVPVPVTRPGDELPCGGVIWKPLDALRASAVIEAFLNGSPPACELALSQCALLAECTETPVMRGWYPAGKVRQRIRERLYAWLLRRGSGG